MNTQVKFELMKTSDARPKMLQLFPPTSPTEHRIDFLLPLNLEFYGFQYVEFYRSVLISLSESQHETRHISHLT